MAFKPTCAGASHGPLTNVFLLFKLGLFDCGYVTTELVSRGSLVKSFCGGVIKSNCVGLSCEVFAKFSLWTALLEDFSASYLHYK